VRTPFQRAVVQLRNSLILYQRLQSSLAALGSPEFFADVAKIEGNLATSTGAPTSGHGSTEEKRRLELARIFATMDQFAYFRAVPPVSGGTAHEWQTFGAAWSGALASGGLSPAARAFTQLGRAWQIGDAKAFNLALAALHRAIDDAQRDLAGKARAEMRFNTAQPFYTSAVLFVAAFLLAVFSWLRWPEALSRVAFALLLVAFTLTTLGIATRMWLEGRPPVTNLYSSALFVGWAAVALCVMLERIYRNSIGSVAGGAIGFATLLVAHHLALGGDTLEMMRAVLDSNFWLATHVVTIAIGYSATFLAGFLAIIYVLRGLLTRSLDGATAASLGRMIYGVVCFATLFSFVGTILGGIWADQSWGRFWGWDPKENGALLIVIWNALLLHVRWAGLVKTRGLACLAIFGNIVTAWSWFGVNMLGVGLHSYGFMDAAFWWLVGFALSQLALIALAGTPLPKWRSFRTA
jgi:ABC-type transport system involved in cytochrome c biogenesis permease subunit